MRKYFAMIFVLCLAVAIGLSASGDKETPIQKAARSVKEWQVAQMDKVLEKAAEGALIELKDKRIVFLAANNPRTSKVYIIDLKRGPGVQEFMRSQITQVTQRVIPRAKSDVYLEAAYRFTDPN